MPLARTQYEADGSTKTFSIPFDYINKSDVVVSVDGSETTDFTWTSGSTIKFSTAPTNGTVIDVLRETERKSQLVDFQDASTLLESDLDLMAQQTFFLAQEAFDQAGATLYLKPDGSYSASTRRIGDLGDPIGPEDATNKQYVDGQLAEAESATDARIAAEHWAEHPEDVEVPEGTTGEYSAHHWANKASQDADSIATDAAQASQDADTASTAATAAEDAQSAAESAQAGVAADASAASDSASAAATSESNAGTYETQAKSHRNDALSYKNTASTQASDASDSANDAFTYKNEAEEWASKQEGVTVEGGEYSAKHYANKAGASASNAASSESAASDSETAASNSVDAAAASANSIGDAETNVVGYAEEAKHWANYPVDSEVPEGSVDEFSARHWADKAKGYAEDTEAAATGVHDGIREGKKDSAPSEDAVFQEFAGLGTAAKSDDADFATSAQGDTADSALQPADVGTAAAEDTTAFASAAQGDKADSALQDASQFATAAQGDKADSSLQPSNVKSSVGVSETNVMSQKAVTDLVGNLGTAAESDASEFASSEQGDKADTALQQSNLKSGTGQSTTDGMSQKAITDAFGGSGVPSGVILMWSGSIATIPEGWSLCDGTGGTPDLQDRFVPGAGDFFSVGETGGSGSVTLKESNLPAHSHSASADYGGAHSHTGTTDKQGFHTHRVLKSTGGSIDQARYEVNGEQQNRSPNSFSEEATDYSGQHDHNLFIDRGGAHSHSVTVWNTGSGEAFSTTPPYYALAYIMKD